MSGSQNLIVENEKLRKKLCCCETDLGATETREVGWNTENICPEVFDTPSFPLLTVTFIGQSGQGIYSFGINEIGTGTINLLKSLKGSFTASVHGEASSGDVDADFQDKNNNSLAYIETSGDIGTTSAFDITELDHIVFNCIGGE